MTPVTTEAGRGQAVSTITIQDGTRIYFKDWGQGQPVVFSHGWPLNADAWEAQRGFLAQNGYRTIAHDRRGHGRSSQPSGGNEMDTYADDLATLIEALELQDAVLVGHSTGGEEITRYIGRHGTSRVAKAVLVGAVPPLVLKTEANPEGAPIEALDGLRARVAADPSQLWRDWASAPFFGANRPGTDVSPGAMDAFWFQAMKAGRKNVYECIKAFSETDFTKDPNRPRRRRPDCPDRRLGIPVVEAREERYAQSLRRRSARSARHARGSIQRRSAGVHQGVSYVYVHQVALRRPALRQLGESQ